MAPTARMSVIFQSGDFITKKKSVNKIEICLKLGKNVGQNTKKT
jgi:hypothetical protein